jgi:uncharacterized repeat protein (TIGR03803 family)
MTINPRCRPAPRHRVAPGLAVGIMLTFALSGARAGTEKVLHTFTGFPDGRSPVAGLIFDSAGNRYGTTKDGGAYSFGTVFELMPGSDGSWTEKTLRSFAGGDEGETPYGGVIFDSTGHLYGTTGDGGAYGYGVVFELIPDASGKWTEGIVYSFSGGTDGANPNASLVFGKGGNLYGTTAYGGDYGLGTVFELARRVGNKWTETVLHSFAGGSDGVYPYAALIHDTAGNLYGTTFNGGAVNAGTVFEVAYSDGVRSESVLHSFLPSGGDGTNPDAGLALDSAGNLYGTTEFGGANLQGAVFELALGPAGWTETVVYSFPGGGAGAFPSAGLVFDTLGSLWGTTTSDGANGSGTVFELAPESGAWSESVAYSFSGVGSSGGDPVAGLVLDTAGNLYGTTFQFGTDDGGVAFEVTP